MACRGVHFALTPDEKARFSCPLEDEGLMSLIEELEGRWDRDWFQETDKAWDAIHRCLTDGTLRYGPTPLHKCILGLGNLHEGDDYIVNFLEPDEVKEVALAIRGINEAAMRRSYLAIDSDDYNSTLSEEDFGYTWDNFRDLREFFEKAARHERAVVFTVDQ
jgi:hypothetical protein